MTTVDNEKERAFWNGAGGETWVRAEPSSIKCWRPSWTPCWPGQRFSQGGAF